MLRSLEPIRKVAFYCKSAGFGEKTFAIPRSRSPYSFVISQVFSLKPAAFRHERDFSNRLLQKGFSLIELIVVMAIIGLLVGVASSSFQTSRIKGKDSKRKSDLKQIQNALEAYVNDHGEYPPASSPTGGTIVACGGAGTSSCNFGSAFTDQNGTVYMAQIPSDPNAPTMQYIYVASSDQKSYQLFAHVENDQDPDIGSYAGKNCPNSTYECTYGVSSANTTPGAALP